jgi:hypothetical protein
VRAIRDVRHRCRPRNRRWRRNRLKVQFMP